MTFGEKLKQARLAKKYTQKKLAELIGAKHNSVSDWENNKNKPDPDTIELLCGVLDITPNYLLNSTTEDFSPKEIELIKKYRDLDDFGKKNVDAFLENEWSGSHFRVINGQLSLFDVLDEDTKKQVFTDLEGKREQISTSSSNSGWYNTLEDFIKIVDSYFPDAAHSRTDVKPPAGTDTTDNTIMDDDNF